MGPARQTVYLKTILLFNMDKSPVLTLLFSHNGKR